MASLKLFLAFECFSSLTVWMESISLIIEAFTNPSHEKRFMLLAMKHMQICTTNYVSRLNWTIKSLLLFHISVLYYESHQVEKYFSVTVYYTHELTYLVKGKSQIFVSQSSLQWLQNHAYMYTMTSQSCIHVAWT